MKDHWQKAKEDWHANGAAVLARGRAHVEAMATATDTFINGPWYDEAIMNRWRPIFAFGAAPQLLDGTLKHPTKSPIGAGVVPLIGLGVARSLLEIHGTLAVLLSTRGAPQLFIDMARKKWINVVPWWRLSAYRDERTTG